MHGKVDQPANPISRELHDAFRMAMGAYKNWSRGQPEPKVNYWRELVTISYVCLLVEQHDEWMPDDLWHLLKVVVRKVDGLPDDQSYRSAARFLGNLIQEKGRPRE
jgi:hypothetical protein